MSENKTEPGETKLAGHSYDGIEELDNSLPKWWLYLFYITIVFGVFYYYHYQFGDGKNQIQEYDAAKSDVESQSSLEKKNTKALNEEELLVLFKNPEQVKAGAAIFTARCVACHGNLGQGGIGPNLTDKYWIHGGKAADIVKTITLGVADKGMPPWGTLLKDEEIYAVASFVRSLHGTNPAGAKAPQGDLIQ